MTDLNQTNINEQPRFRECLEQVRPEMALLETKDLRPINVDPIAGAGIVQGSLKRILSYREQLIKEMPGFDVSKLDKLETYTLALIQSHSLHRGVGASPEVVAGLAEEAKELWETFYSDALALSKHGFLHDDNLNQLKGPFGFRDIAVALLTITNILRSSWSQISTKTPLTEADLNRAEVLSERLLQAIGSREQTPATQAAEALERQQAFTLFMNAYDQVRRGLTYLRWEHGDADDIAPSLYSGRAAPQRKGASDVAATTAPAVTAPVTVGTVTQATATTPAATPKASVGLPGADPFAS
jgi:hypothetical protein